MNIYIYALLFFIFVKLIVYDLINLKRKKEIFIFISFLIMYFISSCRYKIGIDFTNYQGIFNVSRKLETFEEILYLSKSDTLEVGYIFINNFIGKIVDNNQIIFFVTSAIILYYSFKGIKLNSKDIYLSIIIFYLSIYTHSFNGVRQYMAIALFFYYGYKFIIDKKFINYCILLFICSIFFHKSILFMLPVYFIVRIKLNIKYIALSVFFLLLSIIFFDKLIYFFRGSFYLNEYLDSDIINKSYSINSLIMSFFSFILAYVSFFNKKNETNIRILVNFSYLNFILSVFSMKIWLITRFMQYTMIFYIITFPEIINVQNNKYIKFLIKYIYMVFIFIIFYKNITNEFNQLLPYNFFWQNN